MLIAVEFSFRWKPIRRSLNLPIVTPVVSNQTCKHAHCFHIRTGFSNRVKQLPTFPHWSKHSFHKFLVFTSTFFFYFEQRICWCFFIYKRGTIARLLSVGVTAIFYKTHFWRVFWQLINFHVHWLCLLQ